MGFRLGFDGDFRNVAVIFTWVLSVYFGVFVVCGLFIWISLEFAFLLVLILTC